MIKYAKVREVKSPVRGTLHSAGIDFFVPKFTDRFVRDFNAKNEGVSTYFLYTDEKQIHIPAHSRILIPSGVHMNLQPLGKDINNIFMSEAGIAVIAHNKSGIGTKKGLDRLAEVVDEDYQGELHISIVNTSSSNVVINEDDKLIQFLAIPVLYPSLEEVFIEDLYEEATERGAGGFGEATGNN